MTRPLWLRFGIHYVHRPLQPYSGVERNGILRLLYGTHGNGFSSGKLKRSLSAASGKSCPTPYGAAAEILMY